MFPDARFETYPDEAAWLAARRSGLGSSDAAAILGASPHRGAYEVFCDKLGVALPAPDPDNADLMAWGRALEEPILERFRIKSGWDIYRPTRFNSYVCEAHPWLRASLDAVAFRPGQLDAGPIEVKWAPFLDPDDARRSDYLVQNLHQQISLGATWGTVVVFTRTELTWFDVEHDPQFAAQYLDYAERFWTRVLKQEPPEPDGSRRTLAAIAARFSRLEPGYIKPLPTDALLWDQQRQQALEEVRRWQAIADQRKAKIEEAIGDAEAGVLEDGTTYTWRIRQRAGYVVEPLEYRDLRRRKGPLDLGKLITDLSSDGSDSR